MAVRYYATGGRRYYVISVSGYRIDPQNSYQGNGGRPAPTAYSVLDRDYNHAEVETFSPDGAGRTTSWCKRQAEQLAADLNYREAVPS